MLSIMVYTLLIYILLVILYLLFYFRLFLGKGMLFPSTKQAYILLINYKNFKMLDFTYLLVEIESALN